MKPHIRNIPTKPAFLIALAAALLTATMAMATDRLEVTVFAAASTTNAITDINRLYEEKGLGKITVSFAASSTLAKQIDNGAPADIYISANVKWMDYLMERELIEPTTRRDLLSNRIVLIAPSGRSHKDVDITKGFDLAALLDKGRLSMGDPEHVPAGIYGKKALISLGVWDSVKDMLAPAKDVRSALVLVERDEAPIGLVYATDAAITSKVRVIGRFPIDSHPPITYPVAAIKGHDNEAVRQYLDFLDLPEAAAIFTQYGFSLR